jgi:hypothetical protein
LERGKPRKMLATRVRSLANILAGSVPQLQLAAYTPPAIYHSNDSLLIVICCKSEMQWQIVQKTGLTSRITSRREGYGASGNDTGQRKRRFFWSTCPRARSRTGPLYYALFTSKVAAYLVESVKRVRRGEVRMVALKRSI